MSTPTPDIAALFTPGPRQWGLRGDVHLWADMVLHFAGVPVPATRDELRTALVAMFEQLTGLILATAEDRTFHAKYAHGGMSSGYVFAPFWRDTAIPLLLERAFPHTPHEGGG